MLSLSQLQSYDNWIDQTAETVLRSAIAAGGWKRVFPKTLSKGKSLRIKPFPDWASRVRNYFNVTPSKLKQLSLLDGAKAWRAKDLGSTGFTSIVYIDDMGQYWFQMQAIAAIYHYKGTVKDWGWWKFSESLTLGQEDTPIFKLVSPDDSGGSRELCVHNFNTNVKGAKGKSTIGPIDKWVKIQTKVVLDTIYRGSYNYSETGIVGYFEHKYRDVEPHKEDYWYYKNPSMYSVLSQRVFSKTLLEK